LSIIERKVIDMGLTTALNNIRYDCDKVTYLNGVKVREYQIIDLDQALRMIGDNPNKYSTKQTKLDAIRYYYEYKTYYR